MPFIKKNHAQYAQPSSPFIGRTGGVLFFVHNILQPEAPTHNILSISGQGGVGKSTLMDRFIAETHEVPFKDYCLTASVDERQATPISMMEKLAQQLHLAGHFEKALKQYKEALQKRPVERETLRDRLFGSAPDLAGAVVEGIPVAGPLLREGAKIAASHLLKEHQTFQVQQDTRLLETPIEDLTKAFVTDLNRLAKTNVTLSSTRKKRERRIVLFFDTFEQLAIEATPWFLDHFLAADLSSNVVLVAAGRDAIEHTSRDDPKRWLPYCDNDSIYWISLDSFTEDETRMYLVKRGITDADQIANIWHLSRGLPLYLSFLTSNPHGEIDPTKGVVVNFLRWIPEQEPIKRQLALDGALLSKPFTQDDLEAFSYVPESDRTALYQWLTSQPFVRSRSQDGQHLYHDVARDLFSRHLYQEFRRLYDESRRVLAAYYQRFLEKIQLERGKEVYRSEEWLALLLAAVSQLLLLPDQTSHIKAIECVLTAGRHTNREQDREIARVLRDLSQEPSSHHISPAGRSVALQLLDCVEDYRDDQRWLSATGALLETVKHTPSFPSEILADIYTMVGSAYVSLNNRSLAIEHFTHALQLYEATDYVERGWVSIYSGNYREALVVHNQALEQNLQDPLAYIGRGWAYLKLEEYQRAIADFDHAASLDPHESPGGRQNGLRWAYYGTGKYQQSLSANDSLPEGYPEDLYSFRGRCFRSLKDYQQSLDMCNHALELAPKHYDAYFQRGLTYLWLKDLAQAQADFARSCELEPTRIHVALVAEWAGMCQGAVAPLASKRLEAIATVDLQGRTAHICLAIALLLQRNVREALAELEQALLPTCFEEIGPQMEFDRWKAHFWKGMACAFLLQDEEAIAAVEKALELGLPPILLAPLRWLEQERPDFYAKYVVPLLAKHA